MNRQDKNNFIAMQRPVKAIFERFWQMTLTYGIRDIVCILEKEELAKNVYLPLEKGQKVEYGKYSVTCVALDSSDFCDQRLLRVVCEHRRSYIIISLSVSVFIGIILLKLL